MKQRKVMLIGKTGDGKSSTGNTIIGEKVFIHKASPNAVTPDSVRRDGVVDGRKITVIDTPGFFDRARDNEETKSEIIKALIDCAPGIDAFVMVIKVGRYTEHEAEVFQQFLNTLKEDALKHTVILFTFGEQLEGQTIEEFVKPCSQLQAVVNKCGGRCHVIDNKYWNNCHSGDKSNSVQVKNLMETIDKIVEENGRYSNELLQTVEEHIQEEMKINEDNLPPKENQEKAKKIVHKKILEQVAGAATGALIGALLGAGVALASVVAVLQKYYPLKKLIKAKVEAALIGKGGAAVAGAAAVEIGAAAGGGAAVAGAAAVEIGAAAGGGAAVAGAAAVEIGAAAGGGAAVAGAAAAEIGAAAGGGAAVAGAAAAEIGTAAGGGAAAGGAGVSAGMITAGVLGAAAVAGAVGGGVTGWKAAEDADSVCDAMKKAATANYENAKATVEKIQELFTLAKKTP